jgi:uncharacterized membrane protein YozB (DUF420 family)
MIFSLDKAPLFMTLVTIYFLLLPLFLYIAIRFARKKEFIKHKNLQIAIFFLSLAIVFIFEWGVRSSGGFAEFSKSSIIPYAFLSKFLIVHIFIASITLFGWIYLVLKSYFAFKNDKTFFEKKHKVLGVAVFTGLCISSFMGFATYIFLFIL